MPVSLPEAQKRAVMRGACRPNSSIFFSSVSAAGMTRSLLNPSMRRRMARTWPLSARYCSGFSRFQAPSAAFERTTGSLSRTSSTRSISSALTEKTSFSFSSRSSVESCDFSTNQM